MELLNLFKPAKHIPRLPANQVDAAYKKHRNNNFIAIYIGYACYYLLRNNFSIAMPYLIQLGYTKAQLGWVLSAMPAAYGISKFFMGNMSDRSNPRYFIVAGLLVAIATNFSIGLIPAIAASLTAMYALTFLNGWAQGMGAPPCYRTVAHWFPISKRGTVMGVWNTSHNIGASLLGGLSALVAPVMGWKGIFYFPSLIAITLSLVVLVIMRDTPQSVGLMPVEEYSKEYPSNQGKNLEKELSAREILFTYVFVNKYVWFLAMANAFVYFIRYGVSSWAPTYLSETRGIKLAHSGLPLVIYELAGVLGMLLAGYASDKWCKGRRAPISIVCMFAVLGGVLIYWFSANMSMTNIAIFVIGMFIYGPVMLVGVQVLDIVPKKAVGTAIGLLGLFGYWGGTMSASIGFGYIVEHFGWSGGFGALIISCILAIFFFSLTLGIKSVQTKN